MTDLLQPVQQRPLRPRDLGDEGRPDALAEARQLQQILLADASEQAAMLLSRTAALTSELAMRSHAEAYEVERSARERAERLLADAREERERLLTSARQRASQIESEVSRTLSDLQYLDAVRSGQFAEQLTSQREAHLSEFVEFLTRAAAELNRLKSAAASELAHTEERSSTGGPRNRSNS